MSRSELKSADRFTKISVSALDRRRFWDAMHPRVRYRYGRGDAPSALDEVMAGLRGSEIEPSLALIHALRGEGMTIVAVEHGMKASDLGDQ